MSTDQIIRTGTTTRWSDTVAFNGLLFLCEVPNELTGDIVSQTSEVLDLLTQRLNSNASDPGRLLSATIYLPFKEDLAAFNPIWDGWLPAGSAPVRACIHGALTNPLMRVEIQAIAAIRPTDFS